MPNSVQYQGRTADTSRGLSSGVWADCPIENIRNGHVNGIMIDDDFTVGQAIATVTTDATLTGLPYYGFNSTSTITQPDVAGGEILLSSTADNLACYIRSFLYPFQISSQLGDLWFEARVKTSVVSGGNGMICGLWDNVACSDIVPLSTANPPIMTATGNFVGFRMPEGGATIDTIYKADGVAVVAGQTVNSAAATLVASTYVKLGMRFTRRTGLLSWYINGTPCANTKAVPNATGTDFPADVRLGLLFGHRLNATAATTSTIDRWTCAQLFV